MNTSIDEVGLVGLGLMGTAMSGRLLEAGYRVHGFDVAEVSRQAHRDRGGTVGSSLAEVAERCRVVMLSLPNGDVMREVTLGRDGLRDVAKQGAVVVDTTTTRPDEAITVAAELATRGVIFLDVGVSGNSAMVARGDALAMVGGSLVDAPFVRDILKAFCRDVMHAGGSGEGMRAKLIVNHILMLNRFAVAEGLVLAEKIGMDLRTTLPILKASAAYSKAMDVWGQRMVDQDYYPPASRVRTGNKDLQLILELARNADAPVLGLAQVNHVVRSMLANGLGDADNSVVAEMLRRLAGVGQVGTSAGDIDSRAGNVTG